MDANRTKKTQINESALPAFTTPALIAISAALCLLALFQWMDLIVVRSGGETVCGISEKVNCETVWNSDFATRIHKLLGMPIAGLGLVWGLTALALSLVLVYRINARRPIRPLVNAIRLTATMGVLTCITMAVGSIRAGAVCVTCLATYVIVALFAAVAFRMLPEPIVPGPGEALPALGWAAGVAIVAHIALLGPGLATPSAFSSTALSGKVKEAMATGNSQDVKDALTQFITHLSATDQQRLANLLELYRLAPAQAVPRARFMYGSSAAPVSIVDFTDVRCPHCRTLEDSLAELKRSIPREKISLQARHFPLDKECNPEMTSTEGNGVRCAGAKAQICLEDAPDYWELRHKLFAQQPELTSREKVVQIASSGSMSRAQLEACMSNPETDRKLKEDIAFAMQYQLEGTPLVVVNGRKAFPDPAFLYVMSLTGGNPDAPGLNQLPAPKFN